MQCASSDHPNINTLIQSKCFYISVLNWRVLCTHARWQVKWTVLEKQKEVTTRVVSYKFQEMK